MAAAEAARVAAEQEAARVAQEREQRRAEAQRRQREAEAAERARLLAEQERREAEARARAEAERMQREAAERRERERLAALAAAEVERQQKLQRIAELEAQIASIQEQADRDDATSQVLQEAILAAEELLEVLTAEQDKYENVDAAGNPVEPLAKELIAELQQRKDALVQQANAR